MKIRYSPMAREDLRSLRSYLVGEYGAAIADKSVRKIITDIATLKDHPNLLRPLEDKINRPTDFRYFLCGKYSVAISLVDPDVISIVRILDGRSDYATEVFGSRTARARATVRRMR